MNSHAMNSHDPIAKLSALLSKLRRFDFAKMNSTEEEAFRASATQDFKEATSGLHHNLLGDSASHGRWLWNVEQAESHNEWISSYKLRDTSGHESAFDLPALVRSAMARWSPIALSVELFGKYHHPERGGRKDEPRLLIETRVSGDDEKVLAAEVLGLAQDEFSELSQFARIKMRLSETASDEFTNPLSFKAAFTHLVNEAQQIAEADSHGTGIILAEAVMLEVWLDWDCPADAIDQALFLTGSLFKSVILSQG